VLLRGIGGPANLEKFTCKRTISANGELEVVHMFGRRENLSDAELESLIDGFPVEVVSRPGATVRA